MAEIPANLNPCNPQSLPPINQPVTPLCHFYMCLCGSHYFNINYIHPAHIHILFILYSRCTTTFVHVCAMAPMGSAFSLNHAINFDVFIIRVFSSRRFLERYNLWLQYCKGASLLVPA